MEKSQDGAAFAPGRAWLLLCVLLSPAAAAIWSLRWFFTQDGPAHAYNALIMGEILKGDSPFGDFFTVSWLPIPNLLGHYLLMALVQLLSPRAADQVLMTLTLFGLAASIVWLRRQVMGGAGLALVTPLAALLALNWMWLMGFYNFLLGAALFPLTLGLWWRWRARLGPKRAAALAACLLLGYLCHPLPLGLALFGLTVLALLTPGPDFWRRAWWTFAAFLPVLPLVAFYRLHMRARGGEVLLDYAGLDPLSPRGWWRHWLNPDMLSFTYGGKTTLPFIESQAPWFALLAPTVLAAAALLCWAAATFIGGRGERAAARERRGWVVLASLIFLAYLFAPSGPGWQHGGYIRERLLLLAAAASAAVWKLDARRRLARAGAALLVVAVLVQSAFLWEYALDSQRRVGEFLRARKHVQAGRRVLCLVPRQRRFRPNSVEHAPEMLGALTGSFVWNNYEAFFYFFPVRFRYLNAQCDDRRLRPRLYVGNGAGDYDPYKRAWWDCWLTQAHEDIDEVVVYGTDPLIEQITRRRYGPEPSFAEGKIRVFGRGGELEARGARE